MATKKTTEPVWIFNKTCKCGTVTETLEQVKAAGPTCPTCEQGFLALVAEPEAPQLPTNN